jgi:hypothetical protein
MMKISSVFATSHRQRVEQLWKEHDLLVENGPYHAFGYPYGALPALIAFAFLLLPKDASGHRARLLCWFMVQVSLLYDVLFTRARNPSTAGLVGLASAWFSLWTTANLLVVDPKTDYARIQRVPTRAKDEKAGNSVEDGSNNLAITSALRRRPVWAREVDATDRNLETEERIQTNSVNVPDNLSTVRSSKDTPPPLHATTYLWQTFPPSLGERCNWVLDLMSSLDGRGWNWAIKSLPPVPNRMQKQLSTTPPGIVWSLGQNQHHVDNQHLTERELLRKVFRRFWLDYLLLDFFKTVGSQDPYFWGYVGHPAPPYFPESLSSPFVVQSYRMLFALGSIFLAIRAALCLRPLYFLFFGRPESSVDVRCEPWMNPDSFGSLRTILDHGLAGFWSTYWHQSFRHVFEAPANWIIKALGVRGMTGRVIRMVLAFASSGMMHAALSYTAIGETSPLRGPMRFFLLQPLGIVFQVLIVQALRRSRFCQDIPSWLGPLSNLGYCLVWGILTAPYLIDDLARGGQFLFEPIPFSVLRWLGLGNDDDGFYCWHGAWFAWQLDSWRSGIVF